MDCQEQINRPQGSREEVARLGLSGEPLWKKATRPVVVLVLAILLGISATQTAAAAPLTAQSASAQVAASAPSLHPMISAGCSGGRCTVWLSKQDTRNLANWRIPGLPAGVPLNLRAAYYALAAVHVWIAGQYANRGWCSGFRLSIYPWETQGYFGYAC